MNNTIIRIALAALTLGAVGQAATYHVTLLKPTVVAGTELKPGDYKIEVNNDTAVISHGKQSVETKIKTESTDRKFDANTVKYVVEGEKFKLQEIGIGGTKTRLILNAEGSTCVQVDVLVG